MLQEGSDSDCAHALAHHNEMYCKAAATADLGLCESVLLEAHGLQLAADLGLAERAPHA